MSKIRFEFLNKSKKEEILPELFRIFYDNTILISPFLRPYELERDEWLSEVSPALEKEPRQIILIYHGADLAGFIRYSTRGELLMREELQLKKAYQGTLLFYKAVKYLVEMFSDKISRVEAYSLKKNERSIALMRDMGFSELHDTIGTKFLHFEIEANKIMAIIKR